MTDSQNEYETTQDNSTMGLLLWSFQNARRRYFNERHKVKFSDLTKDDVAETFESFNRVRTTKLKHPLMLKARNLVGDIQWKSELEEDRESLIRGLKARHKHTVEKEEELFEKGLQFLDEVTDEMEPADVESVINRVHAMMNVPKKRGGGYYNYFRVKNGYFLVVLTALMFSVFSGILTETLAGNVSGVFQSHIKTLIAMPALMMFFALLIEQSYLLALDVVDRPPFSALQATLLAFLHAKPTEVPHKNVTLAVDLFILALEVWPLGVGVWGIFYHSRDKDSRGPVGAFVQSYIWGGLSMMFMTTFVFSMAKVWLHAAPLNKDKKEDYQEGDGRECITLYQRAIQQSRIPPINPYLNWFKGLPWKRSGLHHLNDSIFERYLVEDKITGLDDVQQKTIGPLTLKQKVWLGFIVIIWVSFCMFLWKEPKDVSTELAPDGFLSWLYKTTKVPAVQLLGDWALWMAVACAVVVWSFSYIFVKKLPDISGGACLGVLAAYCMIFMVLTVSSSPRVSLTPESVVPAMKVQGRFDLAEDTADTDLPPIWYKTNQTYSVCDQTWGSPEAPVSALDLGQLSSIVYDPDNDTNITALLDLSFNEDPEKPRVKLVSMEDYSAFPRYGVFHFPNRKHPHNPSTRVLAVKGTSTKKDAFVDMVMYAAVKVLQQFQAFIPVLSLLPVNQIQWMIELFHLPGQLDSEALLFQTLLDAVDNITSKFPEDYLVLTGHSLGGGMAQTIAARRSHTALVWSAPGIIYSARRFNVSDSDYKKPGMQASRRGISVIMPANDIVPLVDQQPGVVQDIECRDKSKDYAQASALQCHMIKRSICEVWRVCGDYHNRSFQAGCKDYTERNKLGAFFDVDDVSSSRTAS